MKNRLAKTVECCYRAASVLIAPSEDQRTYVLAFLAFWFGIVLYVCFLTFSEYLWDARSAYVNLWPDGSYGRKSLANPNNHLMLVALAVGLLIASRGSTSLKGVIIRGQVRFAPLLLVLAAQTLIFSLVGAVKFNLLPLVALIHLAILALVCLKSGQKNA